MWSCRKTGKAVRATGRPFSGAAPSNAAQHDAQQQNHIGDQHDGERADTVQDRQMTVSREQRDHGKQNRDHEGRNSRWRQVESPDWSCIGHEMLPAAMVWLKTTAGGI